MRLTYIIFLALLFVLPKTTVIAQELYQVSSININTHEFVEEYPVYFNDGIVFISNRSQSALWKFVNQDGQPLKDFFFSKQKDNKKWSAPDELSKVLNTNVDELSICFDSTYKTAYFSKVDEGRSIICSSTFNGREWTNPNPLPFNNLRNYNFFNPCLSPDGKRLYISSNRPGGQGGTDIWVSTLGRAGWGTTLKNLGPVVNSDTSDYAPFMHKNGKLYFVSCRKGSLGADIYWTMEIDGKWLPPKQLPVPINSKFDDYSYISDSADRHGFITSYRNKSEDIFAFIMNFPIMKEPKQIEKNTYRFRFRETAVLTDTFTFLYEWDFGDGTKIKGRSLDVRHAFPKVGDYTVVLNVIDSLTGEVQLNQATNLVQVRDKIQPVISCPDTIYTNEEIAFNSEKSYLPDFKSTEFYWDFGDGTLDKGKSLKHTYIYPGFFKIILGGVEKRKDQDFSGLLSVFKTITVLERKKVP